MNLTKPKGETMRYLTIGIGVVAVVAGVIFLPMLANSNANAQEVANVVTVERTTLTNTIETSGSITASQNLTLNFNTNGRVNTIEVETGQSVTAGQTLATLDTADLEFQVSLKEQALIVQQNTFNELVAPPTDAQLAQARAQLATAQSSLQNALTNQANAGNQVTIQCTGIESKRIDFENAEEAYADYVASGYEWDANFIPDPDAPQAKALRNAQDMYSVEQAQCGNVTPAESYQAQVDAAQASLTQAQANLDSLTDGASSEDIASAQARLDQAQLEFDNATSNLGDAILIAPFDAVVGDVRISVGQLVNSSLNAMSLVDVSMFHVDVNVDELDIAQIEIGQIAILEPDALAGQTLEGTITYISPTGVNNDGVVTFEVRVELDGTTELPIRNGMTTDVVITVSSDENVLVIPTEAIQREGETEFLQIVNADGTTTNVNITTGITRDGLTVISGDITEGVDVNVIAREAAAAGNGLPFGGGR
jgi:HlyD family secretion protein